MRFNFNFRMLAIIAFVLIIGQMLTQTASADDVTDLQTWINDNATAGTAIYITQDYTDDYITGTNLLMANSANGAEDETLTGFASVAGGVITRDTSQHYEGLSSVKVVVESEGQRGVRVPDITVSPETQYTASAYIRGGAGDEHIAIQIQDASGFVAEAYLTLTTEWQRVTVTGTTHAGAATAYMRIVADGGTPTFYVDAMQFEAGGSATAWTGGCSGYNPVIYIPDNAVIFGQYHVFKNISFIVRNQSNVIIDGIVNDESSYPGIEVSNTFPLFGVYGTSGNVTISNTLINNSRVKSSTVMIAPDDMTGIYLLNVTVNNADHNGFYIKGNMYRAGGDAVLSDVLFKDCVAYKCGYDVHINDFICGFDLAEDVGLATFNNVTIDGCTASYSWYHGYNTESSPLCNVTVMKDCIAHHNGIKGTGAGFNIAIPYTLNGCDSYDNPTGYQVYNAVTFNTTMDQNITLNFCRDTDSDTGIYIYNDGNPQTGQMYINYQTSTGATTNIDTTGILNITIVELDFNATPTNGTAPLDVQFDMNDTSGIVTKWQWSWGDSTANGTTQNPEHTYSSADTYSIILTVSNDDSDGSCSLVKNALIVVQAAATPTPAPKIYPTATFSANKTTNITAPLCVQFTFTGANAASYLWDFGDDETSTDQNPVHTYTENGTYTVRLSATNANGTRTTTTTIQVGPTEETGDTSFQLGLSDWTLIIFGLIIIALIALVGFVVLRAANGEGDTNMVLPVVVLAIVIIAAIMIGLKIMGGITGL